MARYRTNMIKTGPFKNTREEGFAAALAWTLRELIHEKRGAIPGVDEALARLKSPHIDQNDPLLWVWYWTMLGAFMGEQPERFPAPTTGGPEHMRRAFWDARARVVLAAHRREHGRDALPDQAAFLRALGCGEGRFGRRLYREARIDRWLKAGVRAERPARLKRAFGKPVRRPGGPASSFPERGLFCPLRIDKYFTEL